MLSDKSTPLIKAKMQQLSDDAASHWYVVMSNPTGPGVAFATVDVEAGAVIGFNSSSSVDAVGNERGSILVHDQRLYVHKRFVKDRGTQDPFQQVMVVAPKEHREVYSGQSSKVMLLNYYQQVWFLSYDDEVAFSAYTTTRQNAFLSRLGQHGAPQLNGMTRSASAPVDDAKLAVAVAVEAPIDEDDDDVAATVRVVVEDSNGNSDLFKVDPSASWSDFCTQIGADDDASSVFAVVHDRRVPMTEDRIKMLEKDDILLIVPK